MTALLCPLAYRADTFGGKIYCKQSGIVCAHQYWCDMACEYKHHPEAATCPGKEADDEQEHHPDED